MQTFKSVVDEVLVVVSPALFSFLIFHTAPHKSHRFISVKFSHLSFERESPLVLINHHPFPPALSPAADGRSPVPIQEQSKSNVASAKSSYLTALQRHIDHIDGIEVDILAPSQADAVGASYFFCDHLNSITHYAI